MKINSLKTFTKTYNNLYSKVIQVFLTNYEFNKTEIKSLIKTVMNGNNSLNAD